VILLLSRPRGHPRSSAAPDHSPSTAHPCGDVLPQGHKRPTPLGASSGWQHMRRRSRNFQTPLSPSAPFPTSTATGRENLDGDGEPRATLPMRGCPPVEITKEVSDGDRPDPLTHGPHRPRPVSLRGPRPLGGRHAACRIGPPSTRLAGARGPPGWLPPRGPVRGHHPRRVRFGCGLSLRLAASASWFSERRL
jgi:hypothetical protein